MKYITLIALMLTASYAGVYYIPAPWIPGKVIQARGRSRADAVSNVSITVWTEAEWRSCSVCGPMTADTVLAIDTLRVSQ